MVVLLVWCHVPAVTAVEDKRRRHRKQTDWPLTDVTRAPPSVAVVTPNNQTVLLSEYVTGGTKYTVPNYICKELTSKRIISDGFCRSVKPIKEVICAGTCVPSSHAVWYDEVLKIQSRIKLFRWRCVDHVVRHRKIRLVCQNGTTKSYRIDVVRGCKCKQYMHSQNSTKMEFNATKNLRRRDRKRRRSRRRRRKNSKKRRKDKKKRRRPPAVL